ncbi:MAG: 4Fe-4S single cluster domain-containing protein [Thermodesulfobacteriota bacterium]|nr:MAG: 4Fe-4S single cluster domain-containing protein [Thermodesulfobacteriota bacterium]
MDSTLLNIHAILPGSRVNGPGLRLVVFFQGCLRGCDGCFNPATHSFEEKELLPAASLIDGRMAPGVEGLTVSGGEPFLQPRGLRELLAAARARGLSTLVYTGFTLEELEAGLLTRECLPLIDVLVDGPYRIDMPEKTLLPRGSTNQRFHFLTDRYSLNDLMLPGRVELFISGDGTVKETGFGSLTRTVL